MVDADQSVLEMELPVLALGRRKPRPTRGASKREEEKKRRRESRKGNGQLEWRFKGV